MLKTGGTSFFFFLPEYRTFFYHSFTIAKAQKSMAPKVTHTNNTSKMSSWQHFFFRLNVLGFRDKGFRVLPQASNRPSGIDPKGQLFLATRQQPTRVRVGEHHARIPLGVSFTHQHVWWLRVWRWQRYRVLAGTAPKLDTFICTPL